MNRSTFLQTAARSLTLVVLAGFALLQNSKRRRLAQDPACIKLITCFDCSQLNQCPKLKTAYASVRPPKLSPP